MLDIVAGAACRRPNAAFDKGIEALHSGRDGGSRTRHAAGYEPEPGTARIAAIAPR